MKSNKCIEIIDGVKGKWIPVTEASEVTEGQRVRYFSTGECYGSTTARSPYDRVRIYKETWKRDLFDLKYWNVEAFFPINISKNNLKVAKVNVYSNDNHKHWFETRIGAVSCIHRNYYTSRKSAIRGAKTFCKTIGFECEIVK